MTYPQQGWGQAPQPQYGQAPQQYQQAQPQYAPQPQPQQGWGQPQQAPQPQYAPAYGQQPPGPQQGWGQPQQPQQPLAQGSVDDFYSQPSSGYGPAWSWTKPQRPMGTTLVGRVARPIQDGDIQQQTAPNGGPPLNYRDGRPQLVMKVPMDVEPCAEHPEGKAQWYVQGQTRDELARAMKAAGAPDGPPEAGAIIWVTWASERRNNYGTMSKQYAVAYQRPDGAPQARAQQQQPTAQQAQPPQGYQQQAPQQPQGQAPQQQQQYPPQQQPQVPAAAAQPPGQSQPAQQPAPAQGQQVPNPFGGAPVPLGQDNAALLASLTGQQAVG